MKNERFVRTEALIGKRALENLNQSTVMIIGLGAVGGYALEGIARSGVGRLILVDFDIFEPSNINRQILALSSTIGKSKTVVAAQRVKEINPECEVLIEDMFVNDGNIETLLKHKPDFVVDAIDTMSSKCALLAALCRSRIPFISSMGAALRTDASCIKTAKLSKTYNCAMARTVRHNLKKYGVKIDDIDCVFSTQKPIISKSENKVDGKTENKVLGSLPTITAIFGLTIANHVIQKLSQNDHNVV